MSNPMVTIEMESGAVMTGELYPELAPKMCIRDRPRPVPPDSRERALSTR